MNKPIARFNTYDFLASALPVFKVRIDSKGFERATMPPIHRSISPYMETSFILRRISFRRENVHGTVRLNRPNPHRNAQEGKRTKHQDRENERVAARQNVPKIAYRLRLNTGFPLDAFSRWILGSNMRHVGWYIRETTGNRNRVAVSVTRRYWRSPNVHRDARQNAQLWH